VIEGDVLIGYVVADGGWLWLVQGTDLFRIPASGGVLGSPIATNVQQIAGYADGSLYFTREIEIGVRDLVAVDGAGVQRSVSTIEGGFGYPRIHGSELFWTDQSAQMFSVPLVGGDQTSLTGPQAVHGHFLVTDTELLFGFSRYGFDRLSR
jgi:hypothetical protein